MDNEPLFHCDKSEMFAIVPSQCLFLSDSDPALLLNDTFDVKACCAFQSNLGLNSWCF